MMKMTSGIVVVLLVVAFFAGWVTAHSVIKDECKTLGRFYVGNEIFRCVRIEKNEND